MRPQQGGCTVRGRGHRRFWGLGGWDHPPLESELCSVGTAWSLPYLCTGRYTHTHTLTDSHAHTHMHTDRCMYTCERAQETHQHNTLTCVLHVCTHVHSRHTAMQHVSAQNSVPVHTQKDTHAHTHTPYNKCKYHPEQVWCEHPPGGLSTLSLSSLISHMQIHARLCVSPC